MPSLLSLIVIMVVLSIGTYLIFAIASDLPSMFEDQGEELIPVENIEKQILTGQITEISTLNTESVLSFCILSFKDDLTEYKVYGLNQGQYELLDLAKTNQEQVTIDYELFEEHRIVQDVKVGVVEPEPKSEPFEFNWWFVALPIGMAILFVVGKPTLSWGIAYIENKKQRKINAKKHKKEKEEKQRINKTKKEEAERKAYKTEGRSSRTAKAAQMLDQQEGKKRRRQ